MSESGNFLLFYHSIIIRINIDDMCVSQPFAVKFIVLNAFPVDQEGHTYLVALSISRFDLT